MHESQLIGKLIDFIYKTENIWRNYPIKNTRAIDSLSHISVKQRLGKAEAIYSRETPRWNPPWRSKEA